MSDNKQLKSIFFTTALNAQRLFGDQNLRCTSVTEFDQEPVIAKEDQKTATTRKQRDKQFMSSLS
ncbi:MAG: hypothetical protein ACQEQL_07875 [Pseudomonadota bacterium]